MLLQKSGFSAKATARQHDMHKDGKNVQCACAKKCTDLLRILLSFAFVLQDRVAIWNRTLSA